MIGLVLEQGIGALGGNGGGVAGLFGHSGAGGSLGFADPEANVAFGYAMNRMENGLCLIGPRATALMNAVFECL